MKRILLVCFLLTATCLTTFAQQASQTATVSAADFKTKVNQLDAQIISGDMTTAQATWLIINEMMKTELGVTKAKIRDAATSSDNTTYSALMTKQIALYNDIWKLKTDLPTNRAAIHMKLGFFNETI